VRCAINLTEAAILLVDDEPQLLEIFGFWLTAAGCRNVYTAPDGHAALALLKTVAVDLLVTDVCMPIVDGITLVRRLEEVSPQIPSVVFISGYSEFDRREMYALGVEAFLAKPILRKDLIDVLEKALADRPSLWMAPMGTAPRQSLVIPAEIADESLDRSSFHVGRGGFIARYRGAVRLGKVAFRCSFPEGQRELVGEGYVRWISKSDQAVGVEFAFLDSTCRSWLLEEMAATNSRSFIPGFI
jgi:CheY-like chemotaxis protein